MSASPRTVLGSLAVSFAVLLAVAPLQAGDAGLDGPAPKQGAAAPSADADSIETLQAAWLAEPTNVGRGIRLQDALRTAGKQRQAETLFRNAYRKQDKHPAVAFLYGRARGGSKGLTMMRAALAARLGRAKDDDAGLLDAWIAAVVVEVAAGNAKEAEQAAGKVTDLRGLAADWAYLGWIRERLLRDPERAQRAYTWALRKDESYLPARNALALLRARAGAHDEAQALARGTVDMHGEAGSAHLHLGLVLALGGDAEGARASYARALDCAQGDADALAAVAAAYLDIEEQALASQALEQALALDPKHGRALSNAGMLAMERGDLKAARAYLKKAGKALPRDPRVFFLQGVCAQRLGLNSSAVSSFRRAASLDPERVEYVTALALAHRKRGALPSAVMLLKRAVKMQPADPDLRLQLGIVYMQQRKYRDARDAFRQAADRADKDPRPFFYLAVILGDKLAKPKEALEALEAYELLGGKEPSALTWLAQLRERYRR